MLGLSFYKNPLDPSTNLSYGDDAINPFRITVDGVLGGTITKLVYLHNDHPEYYYTDIVVSIYDSSAADTYTSGLWRWKLINSIHEPVPEQWDLVENNNIISIDNIGSSTQANTSDFIPIWIRCTVPAGLLADNITDLYLRISATLNLVS